MTRRYRSSLPSLRTVLLLALGLILGVVLLPWIDQFRYGDGEPRLVTPRGELAAEEQSVIELFNVASPSVVYITPLSRQINPWTRNVFEVPRGTGSGFVWDKAGHIVTNYHVIQNASAAQVNLDDQMYNARLVGASPDHDLAVLQIDIPAHRLYPLPIGSSQTLQVGQKVLAIGNPFGLDKTLTTGIISALDRSIQSASGRSIEGVIQTDAAINPGNSGGPLLDSAGRLVGVNTAIYSPSGAYSGIGFAVPVDTVNRVVPPLIDQGEYRRPQFGVVVDDRISHRVTGQLGVKGLLILDIQPRSPAAQVGLRGTQRDSLGRVVPGDIIQRLDQRIITTTSDLFNALDHYRPGDQVNITLWRDGEELTVAITLADLQT